MSAVAVIDTLEFARGEQALTGTVPVADLARLDDILFEKQGAISYELQGRRDERNRALLDLRLKGELALQCQRCLGPLEHTLDVTNTLLVVPPGVQLDEDDLQDPDAPDVIEANPGAAVAELVEEEVLLSLPLAPRHPEGTCENRINQSDGARDKPSAFAQLAALKRPRNQQ